MGDRGNGISFSYTLGGKKAMRKIQDRILARIEEMSDNFRGDVKRLTEKIFAALEKPRKKKRVLQRLV